MRSKTFAADIFLHEVSVKIVRGKSLRNNFHGFCQPVNNLQKQYTFLHLASSHRLKGSLLETKWMQVLMSEGRQVREPLVDTTSKMAAIRSEPSDHGWGLYITLFVATRNERNRAETPCCCSVDILNFAPACTVFNEFLLTPRIVEPLRFLCHGLIFQNPR